MTMKKNKKIDLKAFGFTPFPVPFELIKVIDKNGRTQFAWWKGDEWDYGTKRIIGEPIGWVKTNEAMS